MLTVVAVVFIIGVSNSQKSKIPLIGSQAPSFTALSTNGEITFPDSFGKSWKILFSHPQDFTPVCTSELLELAYLQPEFKKMGVEIAVISVDNLSQHQMWKAHLEELDYKERGTQKINFPLFEDERGVASRKYGMLHEQASSSKDVRGVFIIDTENTVRSINFYPMEVGRNIPEIARIVEALQKTDSEHVLTPANWNEGDDVLIPYFPYTKAELAANPEIKNDYYNVGNRMYFKKVVKD